MKRKKYGMVALAVLMGMSLQSCKKETRDERIKRETMEFTQKNCPSTVDVYTTMDSAVFDMESRTLTYHYTVKDDLDNDSLYTDELKQTFREKVLNEIKTSIKMKGYKDAEVAFGYRYVSDRSGKVLVDMVIKSDEYGKK